MLALGQAISSYAAANNVYVASLSTSKSLCRPLFAVSCFAECKGHTANRHSPVVLVGSSWPHTSALLLKVRGTTQVARVPPSNLPQNIQSNWPVACLRGTDAVCRPRPRHLHLVSPCEQDAGGPGATKRNPRCRPISWRVLLSPSTRRALLHWCPRMMQRPGNGPGRASPAG